MDSPRVTVLMSVYNAERFVAETVESILTQSFRDFEFLIIDDGSKDGSLSILKRYERQDPRIRLIARENRGIVASLNEGLAMARAPLIARMDNDDVSLPERFALQVDFLDRHPEVVCVGGAFIYIDDAGRFLTKLSPPQDNETIQKLALRGHCPLCDPAVMYRRDVALAVGGYDQEMYLAEDLDLWLRMGEVGRLANLDAPLVKYRLHTASVSGANPRPQREKMREACARAWKRRGIQGVFDADAPWRPARDRQSRHRFTLQYGWWAFNNGQRRTALMYGVKTILALPWRQDGYRLLACALMKKMPASPPLASATAEYRELMKDVQLRPPRVTVLLPVYNAERYIAETMESILAQTFTDFELLIIDDGSTDRTLSILKRFAQSDARIRLVSRENRGLVPTLNEGLAMARAPLIARIDSDDIALPDRLALQVSYMDSHEDVVCLGGAFIYTDHRGRFLTKLTPPQDDETIQKLALAGHCSICHPSAMYRRDVALAVGGYDSEMSQAEDLDLWLRLGEVGKLANLDAALIRYRLRTASISGTSPQAQRDVMRKVCERAWKRRGIEGRFEADKAWRPGPDRRSRCHFAVLYGWWAFNSGQRRTALLYGAKAILALPWKQDGYRLVACALLKKLPPVSVQ